MPGVAGPQRAGASIRGAGTGSRDRSSGCGCSSPTGSGNAHDGAPAIPTPSLGPRQGRKGAFNMYGSLFSELHHHDASCRIRGWAWKLPAVFGQSVSPVSHLPSFPRPESDPDALPPPYTEGACSPRLFARLDLHLGQGKARLPEDVHSFHGDASATRLRSTRKAALHRRRGLSSDTTGDRGIGSDQEGRSD